MQQVTETATSEAAGSFLMTIDMIGLGLLGLFLLLGLWRGLWWQLLRLVGLAAAVLVARSLEASVYGMLAGRLGELDERVLHGIVWLGLFLVTVAVFAAIGRTGKKLLDAMQLGMMDRVGGAVAGALTGLVLHAAVLAGLVQIGSDAFIADHLEGSISERLVAVVGVEMPFLFAKERSDAVQQRLVPGGVFSNGASTKGTAPLETQPIVPPTTSPGGVR
ncbi:Colicin V production protein [Planctomycetes bacterium Pla163]|uniref:Colicin V production protein n=1 Tax=Rohdeia mirabilis TaxID=2528008 RepID=A0A518D0K0_9BACT|nr:Colicin V production protein [Planctomycetes bacterium Pla163]